jgi:hypothetical protein
MMKTTLYFPSVIKKADYRNAQFLKQQQSKWNREKQRNLSKETFFKVFFDNFLGLTGFGDYFPFVSWRHDEQGAAPSADFKYRA